VHEADFDLSILEPIGVTARGRRLAPKPAAKVKRIRNHDGDGQATENREPDDQQLPFDE
jgi:hypothetical protein